MYIAAGQGQTTPGTKFWCQQEPLVTSVICYKFQNNLFEVWFYGIFFMILYTYIAPGQGLTNHWGRNFNVNKNILSLRSFVASFKKISLKSDFIQFFFMILYSPRLPRRIITFASYLHILKETSVRGRDIIALDLIHVYSRRSWADNPRAQNFDVNRNLLSLCSFATSFKKISLKSEFIQFFSWFSIII